MPVGVQFWEIEQNLGQLCTIQRNKGEEEVDINRSENASDRRSGKSTTRLQSVSLSLSLFFLERMGTEIGNITNIYLFIR